MLDYPPKIILAFGETISGNQEITNWFLKNGYPELAALSYSIRGSEEAFAWLMNNGFPQYAALDSAIDEDQKAYQWLKDHNFLFLIVFADACHGKKEAVEWMIKKELHGFLRVTQKIRYLRDNQIFDYHKMHF
jgi:hypothetical protein